MVEVISRLYNKLTKELNLDISFSTIKAYCEKYQREEFNLFKLIQDCTIWDIAHVSLQTSSLDSNQLPFPIVVKVKKQHIYNLILDREGNRYQLYDPQIDQTTTLELQEVIEIYDPWMILVEPTLSAKARKDTWYLNSENNDWLIALSFLIVFLLIFLFHFPSIPALAIFLLSGLGLWISSLLKNEQGGEKPNAISEVCENENMNFSCGKVLTSSFSRVFNLISIADLGIFYFAYLMLYVLLQEAMVYDQDVALWFQAVNFGALGFMSILFAVQKYVLKTFCPLCLVVFALVVGINVITYFFMNFAGWGMLNLTLISFFLAAVFTNYFSRSSHFFKFFKLSNFSNQRIINNNYIFRLLFKSNPEELPSVPQSFMLNYKPGAHQLDLVISDTCTFCKAYLFEMLRLLLMSDEYMVSLRLDSRSKKTSEKVTWLNKTLKEFNGKFNEFFQFTILDNKKIIFQGPLEELIRNEVPEDVLKASMANDFEVKEFPSAFLNGKRIPSIYSGLHTKAHLILMQYN